MRVALVTSLVSPLLPAEANGPHAVVIDLARGLRIRGHRPTIYAAEGSVAPDGLPMVTLPVEAGAAAAAVQHGRRPAPSAVRALDRSFERLFARLRWDRPDVVSQHAYDAAAFDLSTGLPAVHTIHLPPAGHEMIAAVRRADGDLVTVSRNAQRAWRTATGRSVGLVRNGVRDLGPVAGRVEPVALIAGRIAPEKGTDAAIRVARRAGLRVALVGDVYDTAFHAHQVAPLLRPGEFIGPVPRQELYRLMGNSAVVLMPVRWEETFGLVAAEAQMAGCPVVGYRRGALPEVVADGAGGRLVAPDDEDALSAAVTEALSLDRSAIRERARRELGVEAMIDAYQRVLLSAASAAEPMRRVAG
jgi:glycosyltransferase involved in cell wall biosynthesis